MDGDEEDDGIAERGVGGTFRLIEEFGSCWRCLGEALLGTKVSNP